MWRIRRGMICNLHDGVLTTCCIISIVCLWIVTIICLFLVLVFFCGFCSFSLSTPFLFFVCFFSRCVCFVCAWVGLALRFQSCRVLPNAVPCFDFPCCCTYQHSPNHRQVCVNLSTAISFARSLMHV